MFVNNKSNVIKPNGPRKTIRSRKAVGKLIGGNIKCLLKLAGTNYWPNFTNSILILEAFKTDKSKCLTYFEKLEKLGVFNNINGIIVGFVYSMQKERPQEEQMEDILLKFTEDYDFPILKVSDFGHNCSNAILPLGCTTELDASKRTITLLEEWVI